MHCVLHSIGILEPSHILGISLCRGGNLHNVAVHLYFSRSEHFFSTATSRLSLIAGVQTGPSQLRKWGKILFAGGLADAVRSTQVFLCSAACDGPVRDP